MAPGAPPTIRVRPGTRTPPPQLPQPHQLVLMDAPPVGSCRTPQHLEVHFDATVGVSSSRPGGAGLRFPVAYAARKRALEASRPGQRAHCFH